MPPYMPEGEFRIFIEIFVNEVSEAAVLMNLQGVIVENPNRKSLFAEKYFLS